MNKWTQEQRDKAKSQLHQILQCDDVMESHTFGGPSFPSSLVDLACQRNELLEALKACHLQMLQSNNDSEYAQEANQLAIAAISKAEGK